MRVNALLPVLLMAMVGLTIYFVADKMGGVDPVSDDGDAPPLATVMAEQPTTPVGTEENYEETNKAEQADYLETTKTVAAKQKAFEDRLDGFEAEVYESIMKKVGADINKKADSQFSKMRDTVEGFKGHLMEAVDQKIQNAPKQKIVIDDSGNVVVADEMPSGLGFDNLPIKGEGSSVKERSPSASVAAYAAKKRGDRKLTLAPSGFRYNYNGERIGEETDKSRGKGNKKDSSKGLKKVRFEKTDNRGNNAKREKTKGKPEAIPYYTMPVNSTLFNNTTLTALMGVVPVKGTVKFPVRFKVITGGENIATNGHYLPDVKNIVWSGTTIGNREMRCVRGIVDKVTFTFNDGTVYTQISSDEKKGMGYITDQWGKPCIPGTLISNSTQYVTNRVTVAGMASLASATSEANTTKIENLDTGLVSTIVDSNTSEFIAGETLSGSLREFADFMKERQLDAVDMVFLHTGEDVTIHVEESINIDYDPAGRKLVHHENFAKVSSPFFD